MNGAMDAFLRQIDVMRLRLQAWMMAARPRTLTIAVSPVIVGTTLAWRDGARIDLAVFAAALIAAVLIQAGTNLHNDAADADADATGRIGPLRVTAEGLLSAEQVRRAAYGCFLLAFLIGIWLVAKGGVPILVIGLLSLAAGLAYSGGPWPISHTPLGEVFVIIFFGLFGVAGSYWLQMHALSAAALAGGLVVGLPAAAILLVNNTRDMLQDMAAGRRTLAIVIGRFHAGLLYAALLLIPYVVVLAPWPGFHTMSGRMPWLVPLTLPYALWLVWSFFKASGPRFNLVLFKTAKLQFAIAALLCLALVQ